MRAPLLCALAACAAQGASGERRSELWTPEQELASGIDLSEHIRNPRPHEWLDAADVPAEFSWMNVSGTNYLTKTLNQHIPQYCGACWAHGTLSALGDRIKIARKAQGVDINLSVQHLLNCGTAGSCHGGTGSGVYNWIKGAPGGIAYDTCQPYMCAAHLLPDAPPLGTAKLLPSCPDLRRACSKESKEGFCPTAPAGWECNPEDVCRTCGTFGEKCVGLSHYPNATVDEAGEVSHEAAMMAEIYARGPIACMVYADDAMENYQGGILDHHGCRGMPNHIVSVVGWGVDTTQAAPPRHDANATCAAALQACEAQRAAGTTQCVQCVATHGANLTAANCSTVAKEGYCATAGQPAPPPPPQPGTRPYWVVRNSWGEYCAHPPRACASGSADGCAAARRWRDGLPTGRPRGQ